MQTLDSIGCIMRDHCRRRAASKQRRTSSENRSDLRICSLTCQKDAMEVNIRSSSASRTPVHKHIGLKIFSCVVDITKKVVIIADSRQFGRQLNVASIPRFPFYIRKTNGRHDKTGDTCCSRRNMRFIDDHRVLESEPCEEDGQTFRGIKRQNLYEVCAHV